MATTRRGLSRCKVLVNSGGKMELMVECRRLDTESWWRRQIGREMGGEQKMGAKKREIEEKRSMKFKKVERDVRHENSKG